MRDENEVDNLISEKKRQAEKNANLKFKQYESEIDRKRKVKKIKKNLMKKKHNLKKQKKN